MQPRPIVFLSIETYQSCAAQSGSSDGYEQHNYVKASYNTEHIAIYEEDENFTRVVRERDYAIFYRLFPGKTEEEIQDELTYVFDGSSNWIIESVEPCDGYDYDRYY